MAHYFWRDPRTIVADLNNNTSIIAIRSDSKFAFAVHGVNGVVNQIRPNLIELASERVHKQRDGLVVALHRNSVFELVVHDG